MKGFPSIPGLERKNALFDSNLKFSNSVYRELHVANCDLFPCCMSDNSSVTRKGNNKHLMTGPEGNSEFCFPRISMFPETKLRKTLRFEGNKIHCSPRDQSLNDLLHSKANGSNLWRTNNHVIDK